MSKWQVGGVCPGCNKPVYTGGGGHLSDLRAGVCEDCCPHCGILPPKTTGYGHQWPQHPYRRVGFLWWSRWEVKQESGAPQ